MVAQLATNEHLLLKHKLGKASSAHLTLPNDEYLSNENGREHGTISSSNGSATLVSGILFYTESWVPWSLRFVSFFHSFIMSIISILQPEPFEKPLYSGVSWFVCPRRLLADDKHNNKEKKHGLK